MKKLFESSRVWLGMLLIMVGFGFLYFSNQTSPRLGYGACVTGIFFLTLATSFVQKVMHAILTSKVSLLFIIFGLLFFLRMQFDSFVSAEVSLFFLYFTLFYFFFLSFHFRRKIALWGSGILLASACFINACAVFIVVLSKSFFEKIKNADDDSFFWPILLISAGALLLVLEPFGYDPYYCFGFGSFFLLVGISLLIHQIKQRIKDGKNVHKNVCEATEHP